MSRWSKPHEEAVKVLRHEGDSVGFKLFKTVDGAKKTDSFALYR